MARIEVEVWRDGDGEDLLRELAQHGLAGTIVRTDGSWKTLEVGYALDERQRLAAEVESALESWIAQQDKPLVPMLVDGTKFVVRPAGD